MRWARRLTILLVVAFVVVFVTGGALLGSIVGRGLPQEQGALNVRGLAGPATVIRDVNGIAQIYADTPHDLFLAQGYVHAQERMWQMEVWRHISAGRLAELFGPDQVKTDRFIRTLGWPQSAQADLDV